MLLSSCLSFSLLLGVVLNGYEATQYAPVVKTKSGKIRGLLDDLNTGGTIRKYLGVPFAKAERFEAPKDPDPWPGVNDAIAFGNICPQPPNPTFADMSEDCLNLNVFVPHRAAGSPLPVMVWIHGGVYIQGSNRIYDGSYIATLGDVIVVAINYRLHVFGFLATGSNGDLKGNYGMLDQIHALKWVKKNIRAFGGNPKKVTIFGESAGGTSVSLHVLSPLTDGLFQNAIMQSGDANAIFAFKTYNQTLEFAKLIGQDNGCTNVDTLADCMKGKSFEQIITATANTRQRTDRLILTPVLDGTFLPDFPEVLFDSGRFNNVNIMMGFNDDDGTVLTNAAVIGRDFDVSNGIERSVFTTIVRDEKPPLVRGQNLVISEAMVFLYTDWDNVNDPFINRRMYLDMASDGAFIAPAIKSAKAFAKKPTVIYMYQLQYRFATFFNFPIPSYVRAFHGADIPVLFGQPFIQASFTNSSVFTKDANFSRAVIKLWTNFAKTGNPNTPASIGLVWPQYDVNQQQFMALKPNLAVQAKLRNDDIAFWNVFIPALKALLAQGHNA